MWAAVAVVLALAPAQDNEAEKLFRQMEDKVVKARTIEFESVTVRGGKYKGSMTLKVLLAEGNKANMAMTTEYEGKKQTFGWIADGKTWLQRYEGQPATKEAVPKTFGAAVAVALARLGNVTLFADKFTDPKAEKLDREKFIRVSDFKMGKKERISTDVEAQAVESKVTSGPQTIRVTVWIDAKTTLPVKRVVEYLDDKQPVTDTETIKTFKLDGSVSPGHFEIPKK